MIRNTLFRHRIFAALVLITLLFLSVMAIINYYQNSKNFLDRKTILLQSTSDNINETIAYHQINSPNALDSLAKKKVFEFANIYNVDVSFYTLEGKFITSNIFTNGFVNNTLLDDLKKNTHIIKQTDLKELDQKLFQSYSYIYDQSKPIGILLLENKEKNNAAHSQIVVLLKQYLLLVLFLAILSGFVAWFISNSLTKKIHLISEKLKETTVYTESDDLEYATNDEIIPLVNAYNSMKGKIIEQAQILKKEERIEAWREMARQMVHEINNPLTPLRLTVQNFHRKFKPEDPNNHIKIKELTSTVVHQIDLITNITKSFSDFAKTPVYENQTCDMVDVIQKTLQIFPPEIISFSSNVSELQYHIDSIYLTRIVTNIVKNGMQAIPDDRIKKIEVHLKNENQRILLTITDNGVGISDETKDKIFQHNFTTKNTGMGIGLSMVKKIVENNKGKIWFESQSNFGTVFFVEFLK